MLKDQISFVTPYKLLGVKNCSKMPLLAVDFFPPLTTSNNIFASTSANYISMLIASTQGVWPTVYEAITVAKLHAQIVLPQ